MTLSMTGTRRPAQIQIQLNNLIEYGLMRSRSLSYFRGLQEIRTIYSYVSRRCLLSVSSIRVIAKSILQIY